MRSRSSRSRTRPGTRRTPGCGARAAVAAAVLLSLAQPLAAQRFRGTLVDELSTEPIAGGFVVVLDTAGVELARAMTDATGRYDVRAPGPGSYLLRAVVVGRRSWTVGPRVVTLGETADERIAMPSTPVRLPMLLVEADRECRVRPEEGLAAGRLWEEAGKVLRSVAWSQREGVLWNRTVTYTRELELRTLRVLEAESASREGWAEGSPFVTATPELLLEEGFIRSTPSGTNVYHGPDATVLLSEPFADLHCFSVRPPGEDQAAGLIGLAFEPVRDREVPDVEGVLWLDAESAELRYLEFWYTRVPWRMESPLVGGRIDFVRLPQGMWIVDRWYIRMPRIALRTTLAPRLDPPEAVLQGIREAGGWVDEVRSLDGRTLRRVAEARLRGTLRGPDGEPLADAVVRVLGTDHRSRTDRRGRFQLDSIPSGTHYLDYTHPTVSPERLPIPPYPVRVLGADTLEVELSVPRSEDLLGAYCPDLPPDGDRGRVGGIVRDPESGAPAPDIGVHVSWLEWESVGGRLSSRRYEERAAADASGFYVVCGVPTGMPLTIWPSAGERRGRETEITIREGRTGRCDLEDPRPRP